MNTWLLIMTYGAFAAGAVPVATLDECMVIKAHAIKTFAKVTGNEEPVMLTCYVNMLKSTEGAIK